VRQALDPEVTHALALEIVDQPIGDGADVTMRAARRDDHRVGERGLGADVEGDDLFGLGIVEARADELGQRFGVDVHGRSRSGDDGRGRSVVAHVLGIECDGQMSDLLSSTAAPNAGGTRHSRLSIPLSMPPTGPMGPTPDHTVKAPPLSSRTAGKMPPNPADIRRTGVIETCHGGARW